MEQKIEKLKQEIENLTKKKDVETTKENLLLKHLHEGESFETEKKDPSSNKMNKQNIFQTTKNVLNNKKKLKNSNLPVSIKLEIARESNLVVDLSKLEFNSKEWINDKVLFLNFLIIF